jgi:hypothetical protein
MTPPLSSFLLYQMLRPEAGSSADDNYPCDKPQEFYV